jgi:hypothetical protein
MTRTRRPEAIFRVVHPIVNMSRYYFDLPDRTPRHLNSFQLAQADVK